MCQASRLPSSSSTLRLLAVVSVAALVAGCSSDSRRFGPAPWSSAMQQHQQSVGASGSSTWASPPPSGEVTGSLPRTEVQQQSLPPLAGQAPAASAPMSSGSWTPPPPAATVQAQPIAPAPIAAAPTPPSAPSRSGWTQGPQPVAQAPSRMPNRTAAGAPAAPAPAQRQAAASWSTPAASGTHTVQSGESLVTIARRHRISPGDLAAANHLGPQDGIRVGQQLVIPSAGGQATAQPVAAPQAARTRTPDPATTASLPPAERPRAQAQPPAAPTATARPATPAPQPQQQAAAQPAPAAPAQPAAAPAQPQAAAAPAAAPTRTAAADTRALPEPQRMTSTEFRWPVRGRVITNFGRQPGGGTSDGIAIQVPAGTPVKAAENGVVAYAGSELRGYGNLVLIRHEGDWVTAYAHNSEILVRRGETVRRGQTIAKAGQSGTGVSQPQVHFEIRRGSTPVNPTEHLTGG